MPTTSPDRIELTDTQRRNWTDWSAPDAPEQRLALRAGIVLAAADGQPNDVHRAQIHGRYATWTKPGNARAHFTISAVFGEIRDVFISPESSSTVHAHTERA